MNKMREIERKLADDLLDILQNESDSMHWTGSTVHLIELVKYIYETHEMTDDDGIVMTRAALTRRVFRQLHVPLPKNLSVYFQRAHNAKGVKALSLYDIFLARERKGLGMEIGRYVSEE